MPDDKNAPDAVKVGTDAYPDRCFGYVTEWTVANDVATTRMADGSEWTLAGKDHIDKYRPLLDLSKDRKKPILLAVNKKSKNVGMIFSTMTGSPKFNGETKDGKAIQVSVPPSTRVFKLRKGRPWFDQVKTAISDARKLAKPGKSKKMSIAFDSVTSEIVDVREASD